MTVNIMCSAWNYQ